MWVIRKLQKTEVRSPRSRLRWFWDLPFSPSSLSQTSIFQLALSESSLIRCILLPRAVSFSVKILDVAKARCRTILRGRLTFFTSTLRSRRLTFCSKPALPLHRCEQRIRPGESSIQEGCRNELTAFDSAQIANYEPLQGAVPRSATMLRCRHRRLPALGFDSSVDASISPTELQSRNAACIGDLGIRFTSLQDPIKAAASSSSRRRTSCEGSPTKRGAASGFISRVPHGERRHDI